MDAARTSQPSHVEPDSFEPTITPLQAVGAPRPAVLTWEGAHLFAWVLLAIPNLVITSMHDGLLAGETRTRLFRHFYGTGQLLAAGVVIAGATYAFRARVSRSPVWAVAAVFVATFTLAWTIVKNDYALLINRLAPLAPALLWRVLLTLGCAVSVPVALVVGRWLSKRLLAGRLRSLGVGLGLVAFVIARVALPTIVLPGTRLLLVISAGTLIAASLHGALLPFLSPRLQGAPSDLFTKSSAPRALPWALYTLWGAYAIFIPPPAQVLFHLLELPAAVLAPFVAELHAPGVPPSRTPEEVRAALSPEPATPPSSPALLPAGGVVVLITIDCLRADLLSDDAHAAELPNLAELRRAGASFTQARSGGNMTTVALSSLFTGRYESQLTWSELQAAGTHYPLPEEDPSPRFPELLAAAGVSTVAISGIEWLDMRGGILRGFTETRQLGPARGMAKGEDLVTAAIDRIEHGTSGPMLLYLHLLDAHDPYDRAGTQGTERERYMRELSLVDREVGRLLAALDARHAGRAVVIVTADHGEAFDEHGTSRHGHNVYDEVVHVPLLVRGPGIVPRTISESVSTMDLGPTVLDLFRQSTPRTFMGTSLVPALAGGEVTRQRPVAIEANGYMAVVDGGWKIMRRKRYGSVELYHLDTDPGELRNVFRERDADAMARLHTMDALFDDVRRH